MRFILPLRTFPDSLFLHVRNTESIQWLRVSEWVSEWVRVGIRTCVHHGRKACEWAEIPRTNQHHGYKYFPRVIIQIVNEMKHNYSRPHHQYTLWDLREDWSFILVEAVLRFFMPNAQYFSNCSRLETCACTVKRSEVQYGSNQIVNEVTARQGRKLKDPPPLCVHIMRNTSILVRFST